MEKMMQYATDKKGFFVPKRLFCHTEKIGNAVTVKKERVVNESFQGFGAALTGSSCYMLSLMPDTVRKAFLTDVYGEGGLSLDIGRLSIAASDYSPSLYSYCDGKDLSLAHFSVAPDEEYVIPMILEVLRHRSDLMLFASPWSPPGWMKTGGSMCGGFMRREYLACYAEYILRYLKAYREKGILISAVTPQNEPQALQDNRMPACVWHPDDEAKFVELLRQKLDENDMDTKIWLYDHNFADWHRVRAQMEDNPALRTQCDAVAFHYYEGAVSDVAALKQQYPDLKWNFTEGGPRLYDHYDSDWCKWGITMANALSAGCDSFTGWNLLLDPWGGPNIGPFFCGGLATWDPQEGILSYSGQYRALRHFSGCIRRGAKICSVCIANREGETARFPDTPFPVAGVLAINPDGTQVLQLVNANAEKVQAQYEYRGTWRYLELMPDSVVTAVMEE